MLLTAVIIIVDAFSTQLDPWFFDYVLAVWADLVVLFCYALKKAVDAAADDIQSEDNRTLTVHHVRSDQ